MTHDPRRERSTEMQPARPLQIMPDSIAFGLAAGGMMLGVILAKAEHVQAAQSMLPGRVDPAPPPAPLPAADATPLREPGAATAADHAHGAQNMVPDAFIHQPDTLTGDHGASGSAVLPTFQDTDLPVGSGEATSSASASSWTAPSDPPGATLSRGTEDVSHLLQDIAAPVATVLPGIAETIGGLPARAAADLADTIDALGGVVDGVEQTITAASATTTSLLQGLPSTLLGDTGVLPSASGILADTVGEPSPVHFAEPPAAPQPAAPGLAAEIVPTQAVEPVDVGMIQLGFLGQSYADAHDAHDLTTHTIGSPFHGFV
jgi:hypothetical protein